jgi:zinc transport system permease protein
MIEFIHDIFSYQFLQNAFLAGLLVSIACGIIGTYIVARRLVFLSGGITHSSFGGIGIAYYLGMNPILGAFVFSAISALGIEYFADKTRMREDSAIGILWAIGTAIGVIFVSMTPGYAPNLMSFLFGGLLGVTQVDLLVMLILNIALILLFTFGLRTILYIAFDKEFAITQNASVKLTNYLMMILISLTIVICIRVVGIVLLIALLTIPVVTANIFYKDFKNIMVGSVVLGFVGMMVGLYFSFEANLPSGAAIILAQSIIWLICKGIEWAMRRKDYR